MEELWEPVVGYKGLYEVSSLGKVRSITRSVEICGKEYSYIGRELTPTLVAGKPYVTLNKNGKKKRAALARVVWKAFRNPAIPCSTQVYCVNGNNCDCSLENLKTKNGRPQRKQKPKYADMGDYVKHKHGVYMPEPYRDLEGPELDKARSMMEGKSGLVRPVVRADGKLYESITEAASSMGVSKAYMRDVVSGKARTCKGYNFRKVSEEELWEA